MRKTIHMRVDIRGFLENSRRKDISGIITDDNGKELNDSEARNFLYDCLARGWKFIPGCDSAKCPDFDYFENGCPGHVMEPTVRDGGNPHALVDDGTWPRP